MWAIRCRCNRMSQMAKLGEIAFLFVSVPKCQPVPQRRGPMLVGPVSVSVPVSSWQTDGHAHCTTPSKAAFPLSTIMSKSPSSRPPKDSVPAYSVPPYVVPPTYNPVVDASLPDNGTRIPLPRNSACLQCRRRRIKCDAAKPQCGACLRSHAWAVRTGAVPCPILDCQYGADSET